jgi:hypothetical protein
MGNPKEGLKHDEFNISRFALDRCPDCVRWLRDHIARRR